MTDVKRIMIDFRALQVRWDAAHERAYALPTPEVCEVQRKFEDGECEIEAFEAVLDAAELSASTGTMTE